MSSDKKPREWHLFKDSAFGPEIKDDLGVIVVEKQAYKSALEQIEKLEAALGKSRELFAYCAGPTRDVKTGKLLDGARICSETIAELEKWKRGEK